MLFKKNIANLDFFLNSKIGTMLDVSLQDFQTVSSYRFSMSFQNPASIVMEGILNFHGDLLFFLTVICVFVFWVLGTIIYFFYYQWDFEKKYYPIQTFTHNTAVEIIWTIIPVLVLLLIAFPSLALLYGIEESSNYNMTVKVSGHQWFWNYEYTDFNVTENSRKIIKYDSYLVPVTELSHKIMPFRLLEVDKRVVVPTNMSVRFLITSKDVLHSWCVPALGVKLDACPGRLNQTRLMVNRLGVFYGQCSEICGVNHAFMPISLESVYLVNFFKWISVVD